MINKTRFFRALTIFFGVVGLCISIAGCILFYFLKTINFNIQIHLWAGSILVAISLLTNYRIIITYLKSARGKFLISSLLLLLLSVYIVICINYISFRHRVRYDYTQTNRFTLSQKTLKILADLKYPIQFVVNEDLSENSLRDLNELLNQFQFHCPKITIKRYNPMKYPDLAASIQKNYSLKSSNLMIVASDTKAASLDKAPLIDSETEKIQWFKGEQAILNAILTTTSSKITKIYFIQGHGETSFNEADTQKPNLLQLKNWLVAENFAIQDLNLVTSKEGVPDDCDILALINPIKSFTIDEINKLENYLNTPNKRDNKGRLFFATNANYTQVSSNRYEWIDTGVETLLLKYGLLIENKIAIELEQTIKNLGFFSVLITPAGMAPHSITEPFISQHLNLAWGGQTRAIAPYAVPEKKLFFSPLLASSPNCKAISDLNAFFTSYKNRKLGDFMQEREGKTIIFAACTGELNPKNNKDQYTEDDILNKGTKIIAVGNGSFLDSPIKETDRDLFINCIRYLTSEKQLIGSGANISQKISWQIPPEKEWLYREIIFYLMPLFWVFIGGLVWWVRKS